MADVELRFRYCITLPGLLKWIAIIFSCIVVGLIGWEVAKQKDKDYLKTFNDGEYYTLIVGLFTIAVEIVLLVTYFFNCHNSICASCRCRTLATWIYFLCLLLWAAAAGVQTWVTTELEKNRGSIIYKDYWQQIFDRRAASAAFCFANVLVFIAALHQARKVEI